LREAEEKRGKIELVGVEESYRKFGRGERTLSPLKSKVDQTKGLGETMKYSST